MHHQNNELSGDRMWSFSPASQQEMRGYDQLRMNYGNMQPCNEIRNQGGSSNVMENFGTPSSYSLLSPRSNIGNVMNSPMQHFQGQYVQLPPQMMPMGAVVHQGNPTSFTSPSFQQYYRPMHHSMSVPSSMSSSSVGQRVLAPYPVSQPMPAMYRQMAQPALIYSPTPQAVYYVNPGMSPSPEPSPMVVNQNSRMTMRGSRSTSFLSHQKVMSQRPMMGSFNDRPSPVTLAAATRMKNSPFPKVVDSKATMPPRFQPYLEAMSRDPDVKGQKLQQKQEVKKVLLRSSLLPAVTEKHLVQSAQLSHSGAEIKYLQERLLQKPADTQIMKGSGLEPKLVRVEAGGSQIFEIEENEDDLSIQGSGGNDFLEKDPLLAVKRLVHQDLREEFFEAKQYFETIKDENFNLGKIKAHCQRMDSICDLLEANVRMFLEADHQSKILTRFADKRINLENMNEFMDDSIASGWELRDTFRQTVTNVISLTEAQKASKKASDWKDSKNEMANDEKEVLSYLNVQADPTILTPANVMPGKKEIEKEVTTENLVKQEPFAMDIITKEVVKQEVEALKAQVKQRNVKKSPKNGPRQKMLNSENTPRVTSTAKKDIERNIVMETIVKEESVNTTKDVLKSLRSRKTAKAEPMDTTKEVIKHEVDSPRLRKRVKQEPLKEPLTPRRSTRARKDSASTFSGF